MGAGVTYPNPNPTSILQVGENPTPIKASFSSQN